MKSSWLIFCVSSMCSDNSLDSLRHGIHKLAAIFLINLFDPLIFHNIHKLVSGWWILLCHFFLTNVHTFSMGLRSGDEPGQSLITSKGCVSNHRRTTLAKWHGAPSCIKIVVLRSGIQNGNLSCKSSRYFAALIVCLGGSGQIAPRPEAVMLPQNITSTGCLTVGTTYLGLYRRPGGRRTCSE